MKLMRLVERVLGPGPRRKEEGMAGISVVGGDAMVLNIPVILIFLFLLSVLWGFSCGVMCSASVSGFDFAEVALVVHDLRCCGQRRIEIESLERDGGL